jgi:hypothetical protein
MRLHRLIAAALVAGCGASEDLPDPIACDDPDWQPAITDLDRSVLAAWGTSSSDVWLVGGGLGVAGSGSLLLHWDGLRFTDVPTGQEQSLWWIWGTPDAQTMWMVGDGGTVLRRRGDAFERLPTETTATLFGVWGAGPDAVWIVGGDPGPDGIEKDLVLHWNGTTLSRVQLPDARGTTILKIWGASADDIWASGEGGTLWHRTASGWEDRSAEVETFYTLNSVHGCSASEVYAVGGQVIFRWDGARWSHVAEAEELISGSVVGVACGPSAVMVVGAGGLKLRLDKATGTWHDETISEPWNTDFHGAWVAGDGDIWAVGGNYGTPASSTDRRIGVVGYRGCDQPRMEP